MRNESVPTLSSFETPPGAPYDPPEPAPQAAAWHRALRVIGCDPAPPSRRYRGARSTLRITRG